MINNKRVLGIIPARGGSKGVPRKNLREVRGKPLVVWAIEEGHKSEYIDRLVLSSEDEEIIRVARAHKCDVPFRRPADLSQDSTPGIEPVLHALRELPGYDYVLLLQPTSPLRTFEDIDACIAMCAHTGSPACVSVTKCQQHPFLMYRMDAASCISALLPEAAGFCRRQDYPDVFLLNGAVYVAETNWLVENKSFVKKRTVGYEMPPERSVDVDSEADLRALSALIQV
jgi:CMP-N,N'-diacetyllegionaminic acid synthase